MVFDANSNGAGDAVGSSCWECRQVGHVRVYCQRLRKAEEGQKSDGSSRGALQSQMSRNFET